VLDDIRWFIKASAFFNLASNDDFTVFVEVLDLDVEVDDGLVTVGN
jgi:hypothetical protein